MAYPWLSQSLPPAPQPTQLSPPSLPSLPLPPPSLNLTSSRIRLTLDKVKLELQAVKEALEEVKQVGEAVEGVREELRLVKEGWDKREAALEKRILDAVSTLLSPFSASLDTATAAILEQLKEREERMSETVNGAVRAARETGKKLEQVEGELRKEVEVMQQRSAALEQDRDDEILEKLEEHRAGLEERLKQVEIWKTQVDGLEKRVEVVEKDIDRLEKASTTGNSPPCPLADSEKAIYSPAVAFATSAAPLSAPNPARLPIPAHAPTTSSSDRAHSPPPRRRPRPPSSFEQHRQANGTPPPSTPHPTVPSFVLAAASKSTFALPLFSSAPFLPSPTSIQVSSEVPLAAVPSRRRLLDQDAVNQTLNYAGAAEKDEQEQESSALSSLTPSPPVSSSKHSEVAVPIAVDSPTSKSRRRRIEQDVTPVATQEEEGRAASAARVALGEQQCGQSELEDDEEPSTQE